MEMTQTNFYAVIAPTFWKINDIVSPSLCQLNTFQLIGYVLVSRITHNCVNKVCFQHNSGPFLTLIASLNALYRSRCINITLLADFW